MNEFDNISLIIIPPDRVHAVLDKVEKFYLRDCVCRARAKNCPPEEWRVCLLTEHAPKADKESAMIIPRSQAQKLLNRNIKSNKIFTLFFSEQDHRWTELCSCCTCCCSPIQKKVKEEKYQEYLRSSYLAYTDDDKCVGCGSCITACPFEARKLDGGILTFSEERCFGCERCINECPESAIIIIKDSNRGMPIPGLEEWL